LVTLQGDDIFLDELPEPFRSRAFDELYRLVEHVDGFVVHSQYYADFMADYFRIPKEKIHRSVLGIETADFTAAAGAESVSANHRPPTIGYLARLAPEKGLHQLVDAFIHLRQQQLLPEARLEIAGWLGAQNRAYAEEQFDKLRAAGLADAFRYRGSVSREEKSQFLNEIDVLSVPTTYHDPKGLFVLEALAARVPVVQPSHGTFPELIAETGGGLLSKPDDHVNLAETICELLSNSESRQQLGQSGNEAVRARHNADAMAARTLEIYRQFVEF
jgi:glycosyltransferase involved in cell wall biosynthesis